MPEWINNYANNFKNTMDTNDTLFYTMKHRHEQQINYKNVLIIQENKRIGKSL